jgi:hypothetical protein
MSVLLLIAGAAAALGIGIWVGIGAPGWPHKPKYYREHTQHRSINPIAWGRTPSRERQRPRAAGERRGPKIR